MDISIGVDCEEISRFQDVASNKKLMKKLFTKREIDYCMGKANPPQHFAARFAGKEAVIKALAGAGKGISINEIEILNDDTGVPMVNILKDGFDSFRVKLSLSHCKDMAVASAVVIH